MDLALGCLRYASKTTIIFTENVCSFWSDVFQYVFKCKICLTENNCDFIAIFFGLPPAQISLPALPVCSVLTKKAIFTLSR